MRARWSDAEFAEQVSARIRERNVERWADPEYAQRVAERARSRMTVHGLHSHPLYDLHFGMMSRCYRPTARGFRNYGGRGIQVYGPWHDLRIGIPALDAELGPRPVGRTLDRIDNDGHYSPGNVRWATPSQQMLNQGHGGVVPMEPVCTTSGCICGTR